MALIALQTQSATQVPGNAAETATEKMPCAVHFPCLSTMELDWDARKQSDNDGYSPINMEIWGHRFVGPLCSKPSHFGLFYLHGVSRHPDILQHRSRYVKGDHKGWYPMSLGPK